MTVWGTVGVSDAIFGVVDGEGHLETADWGATGLIVPMDAGAFIGTGIHIGRVRVGVDISTAEPSDDGIQEWDDVAEASLWAPTGELRVHALTYGTWEEPPDLPPLSQAGPGHYRVRVHVRGRDLHHDKVMYEPHEEYLMVAWPADPLPPLLLRATDRTGRGLRWSALLSPGPVPAPVHEPGPPSQAEDFTQAILDGVARAEEKPR